jgi:diguanylate cyclase (GGDEF)-like protein
MDNSMKREKPLAMVVDDDFSLRLSMRAALIKADFDVLEAENGRQALDIYQSEKPDLILLDVVMPEMDGFETCTAIRKMPGGKYVQILMVTGLDDIESIELAFQAGANDFVSKPLNWLLLGHKGKYMLRAGRAFQSLSRSKKRLNKTQEIAKIGNWEIIFSNNQFHCSQDAWHLLGFNKGKSHFSFKEFLDPVLVEDHARVKKIVDGAVGAMQPFSVHYRIMLSDKTERHILNQAEIIYNENKQPEIMMGVIQDVTRAKLAEEEIRQLAFYDNLTGLANRSLFQNRLEHEIIKAKRQKEIFGILFLDLDQFKRVNDTYGHHIGDLLLKNTAKIIQKSIRDSDTASRFSKNEPNITIARFGGDEFIILLSNIKEPENAAISAKRILVEMPNVQIIEDNEITITTSIGISIFPTDGTESHDLLKNADYALFQAKECGRNKFKFYEKSLNLAAIERFALEKDLYKAMDRDELVLYYQPQIDLETRKIVGAEALIRWLHPKKGMIPPDKFIPIAEETGLIHQINKWVIGTACKQNNEWAKAGIGHVRIAINLSGYQLAGQNIVSFLQESLKENNLDPQYLEVEITESVLMQDSDDTISTLQQIKDMQIVIALDDFGTGYSSLSYLTSFHVDTLKIDRSFIMGCPHQKNNIVVIKAIIAMGRSMGMKIVAEGIETDEQLELVREFGVDEGQGYLFKPPVPQEKFFALVSHGTL